MRSLKVLTMTFRLILPNIKQTLSSAGTALTDQHYFTAIDMIRGDNCTGFNLKYCGTAATGTHDINKHIQK